MFMLGLRRSWTNQEGPLKEYEKFNERIYYFGQRNVYCSQVAKKKRVVANLILIATLSKRRWQAFLRSFVAVQRGFLHE